MTKRSFRKKVNPRHPERLDLILLDPVGFYWLQFTQDSVQLVLGSLEINLF